MELPPAKGLLRLRLSPTAGRNRPKAQNRQRATCTPLGKKIHTSIHPSIHTYIHTIFILFRRRKTVDLGSSNLGSVVTTGQEFGGDPVRLGVHRVHRFLQEPKRSSFCTRPRPEALRGGVKNSIGCQVATAISKLDEKEHVAEAILGQVDVPWEDVLKFLISMRLGQQG